MTRVKVFRSITEVLECAIKKEKDVKDYFTRCAEEVGDQKVKDYLLRIAQDEQDHLDRLKEHLSEVQAQLEIDQAIMESYEHWEDQASCYPTA
jgi:rubrerythrin